MFLFLLFSRLHVSSRYHKEHSVVYCIIKNSYSVVCRLSFLRDGVSCERAVSLFVFSFLIVNRPTERQAEICHLPFQCCRTRCPTLYSITKLGLLLPGLRASVVFFRQEKANKFKLNANTVIVSRGALTVTFSIFIFVSAVLINIKITLVVKLGKDLCPSKDRGAESEQVLCSKSLYISQIDTEFTFFLAELDSKTVRAPRKKFPFISNKHSLSRVSFSLFNTFCRAIVFLAKTDRL